MQIPSSDIDEIISSKLDWNRLAGKSIAITGANGMLAAHVVESLLTIGRKLPSPIQVKALVRNPEKAADCFYRHLSNPSLSIVKWTPEDNTIPLENINIVIHAASIPRPDTCRPADVVEPNVIGTWNLLKAVTRIRSQFEQFVFFSSNAVYGETQELNSPISEDSCFPVNQLRPQACYAESKRAGENICIAFMRQYGIPIKIVRFAHTFGSNMDLDNDQRSFVSFVKSIKDGKDVKLLADGKAKRYFCYATDATVAFFMILLRGKAGEAYNIANPNNAISIRELAELIVSSARRPGLKVIEHAASVPPGYAPHNTTPCLDISKLSSLGWNPKVSVKEGFSRVLHAINA